MKNILVIMLVIFGTSCRTQRVVSTVTRTDSTTTITYRPIHLEIKPDSLSDTLTLRSFTHLFNKAAIGAVIAQKRKGRTSYTIRKSSPTDFEVQAQSAGKDTTSTSQDTKTVVRTNERVEVEQVPTMVGKLWQGVKDYALLSILLLLLVLVLVLIRKFMA